MGRSCRSVGLYGRYGDDSPREDTMIMSCGYYTMNSVKLESLHIYQYTVARNALLHNRSPLGEPG